MGLLFRRLLQFLVMGCLGAAFQAAGAGPAGVFRFRSYGSEQGLQNPSVIALAQDAEGCIWAGTEDGLFRYDGLRFQSFGIGDGLPSTSIQYLFAAGDGALYVSTPRGLRVFRQGRFESLAARGVPEGAVHALAAAPGGHLVLSTADQALEGRDGGPLKRLEGLPAGRVSDLWMGPDGQELLAVHKGRLWRRMGGCWESRDISAGLQGGFQSLLRDRQGRIWLRSVQGLCRMASFEAPLERLPACPPAPAFAMLAEDAQGHVWTNANNGLSCYEEGRSWVLGEREGLPTSWASCHLIDREGNLWVGSEGVHRLQGRFLWRAHTSRQGLPGAIVWNICRGSDGLLWAATNRGIAMGGPGGWRPAPGTQGRAWYSLHEDDAGGMWAGGDGDSRGQGALAFRSPGSTSFQVLPVALEPDVLPVYCVLPLGDGELLAGTDGGAFRISHRGGAWRRERIELPGQGARESVIAACKADGEILLGTSNGLVVGSGHTWARVGVGQGLKEPALISMSYHPAGNLWVAYANRKGLTRLRRQDGAWKAVEQLDGPARLTGTMASALAQDARGILWVGTSQGVRRWDGQRLECYGRGEGLPGEDCAQGGLWADPDGKVWVGTTNGVGEFQPGFHGTQPPPPRVRILFVADGGGQALGAEGLAGIPYALRNLSFRFLSPSYLNEARIIYRVRLAGFEDTWRETDVHEARYTALPPGHYRFEVCAIGSGGETGPVQAIAFRILPPWWRAWWVLLLEAGGILALVGGIIFWRTALLRRRNAHLEVLVSARTAELASANTALESANKALETANRALEETSLVDPLTELRNRRYLHLALPESAARVQRSYRTHLAQGRNPVDFSEDLVFLMVDIDHFKAINDTHGHLAGDAVLAQVARVLRGVCREGDSLVRWGGEEFLVVANRASRAHAPAIARNLLEAFRSHAFRIPAQEDPLALSCSIGYAVFPFFPSQPDLFTWQQTVELADQCLYAAKRSGRDAWVGAQGREGDLGVLSPGLPHFLPGLEDRGLLDWLSSLPEGSKPAW